MKTIAFNDCFGKDVTLFKWLVMMVTVLAAVWWAQPEATPSPVDYALRGPYAVGTRTLSLNDPERPLQVTVWYPAQSTVSQAHVYDYDGLFEVAGNAEADAEPDVSGAPYPLVVFSHASGGYRLQSTYLTEHLASYGAVVIAPDHAGDTVHNLINVRMVAGDIPLHLRQRPADLQQAILAAERVFPQLVDVNQVIAAGHSLGATGALLLAGARIDTTALDAWCDAAITDTEICALPQFVDERTPMEPDSRIKGVIALAPWNGPALDVTPLREMRLPVLIIAAEADTIAPPQRDALRIYAGLDIESAVLVMLGQAGHFVFVDGCPPSAEEAGLSRYCTDPVWDMRRAHARINHAAAAFVLATTANDAGARAALEAEQGLERLAGE